MIHEKPIKLGFVPIRRNVFDVPTATRAKYAIEKKIHQWDSVIDIIDCNEFALDGLIFELPLIDRIIQKMRREEIDGLFLPHCNFGTEEVAVRIARALDVPVLLWGARDTAPIPGRIRLQDTQCGLFATSKGLSRAHVPFSYIVNCDPESETFVRGFDQFLRVVSVVRAARRRLRIMQVGARPRPFMSVMCDESDLFAKFGVCIVPQPTHEIARRVEDTLKDKPAGYLQQLAEVRERISDIRLPREAFDRTVALAYVYKQLALENECYAIAGECWTMVPQTLGIRPCFAHGELTAMGLPVSCETDILGAVTSVLLQAADLDQQSTFFADLTIRHPDNDNAELLWHCGPFPYALRNPQDKGFISDIGKANWRLKDGDITLCRFDGMDGEYRLLVGQGRSCPGPETEATYVWFETDNWERWEEKLIFGPYIHHVSGLFGRHGRVMAEAVKYIPNLQLDAMDSYRMSLGV